MKDLVIYGKAYLVLLVMAVSLVACGDVADQQDGDGNGEANASEQNGENGGEQDNATENQDNDSDDEAVEPPEGWENCDCPNPDDFCIQGQCGQPDVDCSDEDDACPDGYDCRSIGKMGDDLFDWWEESVDACVCDGEEEECAPRCESNEDCPHIVMECDDMGDNICRRGYGCVEQNYTCPDGYICPHMSGAPAICLRAGDGAPGDGCDDWSDCESGTCDDGICKEQCLSDDDCPDGEGCRRRAEMRSNGCMQRNCEVSCPDGTTCSGDTCGPPACETNADCPEGDCVMDFRQNAHVYPNRCREVDDTGIENRCKDEEFFREVGSGPNLEGYCFLEGRCWGDESCPSGYECQGACRRLADSG